VTTLASGGPVSADFQHRSSEEAMEADRSHDEGGTEGRRIASDPRLLYAPDVLADALLKLAT